MCRDANRRWQIIVLSATRRDAVRTNSCRGVAFNRPDARSGGAARPARHPRGTAQQFATPTGAVHGPSQGAGGRISPPVSFAGAARAPRPPPLAFARRPFFFFAFTGALS